MNPKQIIQEEVEKGHDPLTIIEIIAATFRLKCLKMLNDGIDKEKSMLGTVELQDSTPFSRAFLDIIEKNDNAVVGLYLTDQLIKITHQIKKEMRKANHPPF